MPDAPSAPVNVRTFIVNVLRDHLGVVLTVAGGALVAVRVFSAAAFNPDTALIILQTQGTTAVIFGTLLPLIPAVLPLIASAIFFGLLAAPLNRRDLAAAFAATALSVLVAPPGSLALVAFSALIGLGGRLVLRWVRPVEHERDSLGSAIRGAFLMVIPIGVAASILVNPPWFPAQRIEGINGGTTVGYVLNETDEELIVLQYSPRLVVYLQGRSTRAYCHIVPPDEDGDLDSLARYGTPLGLRLIGDTEAGAYPDCPEAE